MILSQQLAYTLCTMIAVGFIEKMGASANIIYEINDDPTSDEAQKREAARKAQEEKEKHESLKSLLQPFGVNLEFRAQENKRSFPFILAKSSGTTEEIRKGVVHDLLHVFLQLETEINTYISENQTPPLRGVYVGGLSTVPKVKFLGASDLYLYPPRYREVSDSVKKAFLNAAKVSNIVIDILPKKLPMRSSTGIMWEFERRGHVPSSYEEGKLFASVHGMTQSIIHFRSDTDSQSIRLELALGKDTCKVASCVPCSIFMKSNNTPATATHLGRGDNWNFPKGERLPEQWKNDVKAYYTRGKDILGSHAKVMDWERAASAELARTRNEIIPSLFLEALTFESSFIDKMTETLS